MSKAVCFICKVVPVKHRYYPCSACRKLWAYTKAEIERLRFMGVRIDVDFSDAPIADSERIAAVSAVVCKLTTPKALA
jgi:hypothetical protein